MKKIILLSMILIIMLMTLNTAVLGIVSHNASEVTPGSFQVGNYYFPDGNVGIGTTNPNQKLEVGSNIGGDIPSNTFSVTASDFIATANSDSRILYLGIKNNYGEIQAINYSGFDIPIPLILQSQGGNVGIGTITPQQDTPLHVVSNVAGYALIVQNNNASVNSVVGIQSEGVNSESAINFLGSDLSARGQIKYYPNDYLNNNSGMYFKTNAIDRIFISNKGNVGIGSTSPANKLQIGDFSSHAGYGIAINSSIYGLLIQTNNHGAFPALRVLTNGSTESFRVNNDGNVGIGTDYPVYKLHIEGLTTPESRMKIKTNYSLGSLTLGDVGHHDNSASSDFTPAIGGHVGNESDSLLILSGVHSEAETGGVPAIILSARGHNSAFSVAGKLSERPILGVTNYDDMLFTISNSGNVGIGINNKTSSARLYVYQNVTSADDVRRGVNNIIDVYNISNSEVVLSTSGLIHDYISENLTKYTIAGYFQNNVYTPNTISTDGYAKAIAAETYLRGDGKLHNTYGILAHTGIYNGGADSNGFINNNYVGYFGTTNTASGVINNTYGVYIAALHGNNKYGIYQTETGASNYFGGNVGIGTSNPTALLDIVSNQNNPARISINNSNVGGNAGVAVRLINDNITSTGGGFFGLASTGYSSEAFSNRPYLLAGSDTKGLSLASISDIKFYSGSDFDSSKVVISPEGNVGIGTTTPGQKLTIYDNVTLGEGGYSSGINNIRNNYTNGAESAAVVGLTEDRYPLTNTRYNMGGYFISRSYIPNNIANNGYDNALRAVGALYGNGTLAIQYVIRADGGIGSGNGTITNSYLGYFNMDIAPEATIENGYGLYIGDIEGNTQYGIYQTDAAASNYFAGDVGLGTTDPTTKLEVSGSPILVDRPMSTPHPFGAFVARVNYTGTWARGFEFANTTGTLGAFGAYGSGEELNYLWFGNNYVNADMVIENSKIGINTTTPSHALNVVGDINATGDIYKMGNIAVDYVFDSYYGDDISKYDVDYSGIMPLDELAAFTEKNRHLPRFEQDKYTGQYEVGTMDEMLLEKIEEAHLYIIELRKDNDALQERIEKLEDEK